MRILVLGRNGMLGHVVYEYFRSIGDDVYGTDVRGNCISYDAFKNQEELENIVKEYKPEVVINCIGILNQVAEDNKVLAVKLNSLLPHYIDSLSEKYNFKFIHVSTDCVFDGKKGKYDEDALPDATSFYGRSKALGEVINNSFLYKNLKIKYLTVHTSKGLESEEVIVLNVSDDLLGFPNKLEDDEVLKLFFRNKERYLYAEERRLFYVALTRTKNNVYLMTRKNYESLFVLEIKNKCSVLDI